MPYHKVAITIINVFYFSISGKKTIIIINQWRLFRFVNLSLYRIQKLVVIYLHNNNFSYIFTPKNEM